MRDCKTSRPKSILILDEYNSLNNGEMARVMCISDSLRLLIPGMKIAILSSSPQIDNKRYNQSKLIVVKRPWSTGNINSSEYVYFSFVALFSQLSYITQRILGQRGKLHQYDGFVHLTGDVINDRSLRVLFYHLFHIIFGLSSGKKTIICAESIGPFKSKFSSIMARIVLNKVDLITVREKISIENLKSMNIKNPNVFLISDPAFLLKPAFIKLLDQNRPVIGMAPNPDIVPYLSKSFSINCLGPNESYAVLLATTIDEFIEKYNASAILVTHVLRPDSNDLKMSELVYSNLKHKEKVQLQRDCYDAGEVKSFISSCDIFVASRMHAAIAAISSCVPTIVLGHAHKFRGVLHDLINENCAIDVRGSDFEELKTKLETTLDFVWKNHMNIVNNFCEKLPFEKENATINAKLIAELINKD